MTFNRMPPDALNHVVLGTGVIFSGNFPSIYELQDNADDSSILGATSGGVSVDLKPKITTFSVDGNSRRDVNYIRYDSWAAKLSCKMVTLSPTLVEYALSGTESSAISQLEVIPQWCGVDYCYGGWKLVDVGKDEEETALNAAESETEDNDDKVLVETERKPITWEDIPWQISRDLRLSVTRGADTVVDNSEDWKVAIPGNSTLNIKINSPEDSIIQSAYTEISIGEGRYQFKPHTHTRLSLQVEPGSVLMDYGATYTYTASILPEWNYELDDEETEKAQSDEESEEDSLKKPKEQYVWQILTYTGDPVDVEELEGLKEPNEEKIEEDDEEEEEELEEEEQEQIAFTCGKTVTVRGSSPGTVVLRCTATRLDARASSDLIITVLPAVSFCVRQEQDEQDTESPDCIPFMVKSNSSSTEPIAEGEPPKVLEFVKDDTDGGDDGENSAGDHYLYFYVGNTSGAQEKIEEMTKQLRETYAGRMEKARQRAATAMALDEGESDENEEEYDEELEVFEEAKNASGWADASAGRGGGVSTAAQDIWWVGNYGLESDGSKYVAIHLKNATLTSGLQVSSHDVQLAQVSVTFESAYDNALEDALPFEVYFSMEGEGESPEPEEGAEE